jgi:hypothetical protein
VEKLAFVKETLDKRLRMSRQVWPEIFSSCKAAKAVPLTLANSVRAEKDPPRRNGLLELF